MEPKRGHLVILLPMPRHSNSNSNSKCISKCISEWKLLRLLFCYSQSDSISQCIDLPFSHSLSISRLRPCHL